MKFIGKYQYFILVALGMLAQNNFLSAQEDAYHILFTGNTFGNSDNDVLNDNWIKKTVDKKSFAILLGGNTINFREGSFSNDLTLDKSHPLLIAPGKSEWDKGRPDGKDFLIQFENRLKKNSPNPIFFPETACPGPTEVILSDYLVVILIDTWWWVHSHDRRFNKCNLSDYADVLVLIEDAIKRHYSDKHVVVLGHHNLYSNGNTSGFFSPEQWLYEFPITFFRKFPGTKRDNQYPDFKNFRKALIEVLAKYPDILYLSSGEENLQYLKRKETHYVISGSYKNQEYVNQNTNDFGVDEQGFASLCFTSSGNCKLAFYSAEQNLFQKTLYHRVFESDSIPYESNTIGQDSVLAVASKKYSIPNSYYKWMGKNYRDIWSTPVKLPVFDLVSENQRFKVLKRGGGQQTFSLRLTDENEKEYVLRSIDKNVEKAIPTNLQNEFAIQVVQDQISASNPYAAPVVAELAKTANIPQSSPKVVYISKDNHFGIYKDEVADAMFLFEERPANTSPNFAGLNQSCIILSTEDLLEKVLNSPKNQIDERALLRARLFDVLINDWDRHEDQWRWAGFESNDHIIYKPIPRDRDQAFFVNEGFIPRFAAQKCLLPKIQGFDEFTENMKGQSFNARIMDRTYLIESDWSDWLTQIDSLKKLLPDEKIDLAMTKFPEEVVSSCGMSTGQILKKRLTNLELMARSLYLSLSKEVCIHGTNEDDYFEISSVSENTLRVTISESSEEKQKGKMYFDRTFYTDETKQIILFGLDGKDVFNWQVRDKLPIKIKILEGKEKDELLLREDQFEQNLRIIDNENTEVRLSNKKRWKKKSTSEIPFRNEEFEFDLVCPGIYTGFNIDDGIFLGGGPVFSKYSRFRKQQYSLMANYAHATDAFNIQLHNHQSFPLSRFDINYQITYSSPGYGGNFFGMGNETKWEVTQSENEYYRLKMGKLYAELDFIKWLSKTKSHKAGPGVFYKVTDLENISDRFVSQVQSELNENDFYVHQYMGVYVKYEFTNVRSGEEKQEVKFMGSDSFYKKGISLSSRSTYFQGLNSVSSNFSKFTFDFIYYHSFSQRPRVIYALRFGGEKLLGNYPFHEAAKLGSTNNLRGFRETRFYGDASFYINIEARIRIKQIRTYMFNGVLGILLYNDLGRVWLNTEESGTWHNGTGVGFWAAPFDTAILSLTYTASKEDNLLNFKMSYQF